jgi:hypothetical protein
LFYEPGSVRELAERVKVTPRGIRSAWLRLQRQGRLPMERPHLPVDNTGDYVPIEETPQPIEPPPELPEEPPAPKQPRRDKKPNYEYDGRPEIDPDFDPLLDALYREHKAPRK